MAQATPGGAPIAPSLVIRFQLSYGPFHPTANVIDMAFLRE
jgi:hypothetical protein